MALSVPVQFQSQGLSGVLFYCILYYPCHGIPTLNVYHN